VSNIFNKNDIITLQNNENYTVLEVLEYNDKEYLYIALTDEDEQILDEYKIVYLVKDKQGNYGIREVTDNSELADVTEIFIPMLENDYRD